MFEYIIINKKTGEETSVYGYDIYDAFERSKLNYDEWECANFMYID